VDVVVDLGEGALEVPSDRKAATFVVPALLQVPGAMLSEWPGKWHNLEEEVGRKLASIQHRIDEIAFRSDGEDRKMREAGARAMNSPGLDEEEPGEES
jgi:hypothetical protein